MLSGLAVRQRGAALSAAICACVILPSFGCWLTALCVGCTRPGRLRVNSASFINALADYGRHNKGLGRSFSIPTLAPDVLWRLGKRIPTAGWPIPAVSRLQILGKSAVKA